MENNYFIVLFGSNSRVVNIVWYELRENIYYFTVTPWKCIVWYELWKMCVVLFGVTLWKCHYCFIWTLIKTVLCDTVFLKVLVLFDRNSGKTCVVLFCITLWKCQNCFIWSLKLSNFCFVSLAYLKQRSFIAFRKFILKYLFILSCANRMTGFHVKWTLG